LTVFPPALHLHAGGHAAFLLRMRIDGATRCRPTLLSTDRWCSEVAAEESSRDGANPTAVRPLIWCIKTGWF